jgi:serine/threonine protein phosphatase PrpC
MIKDGTIYCANAGDSRAVLCSNGIAINLSEDHKPDNKGEKDRIYKAGSTV